MMNWKLLSQSQSEPCLAFSEDFSGDSQDDNLNLGMDENQNQQSFTQKYFLSSTTTATTTSDDRIISSSTSSSVSSLKLSFSSHPSLPKSLNLSWQRKWLLIPGYTVIFMAVLPFVQGCLYTIGYRAGKTTLKFILNKK